MEENKAIPVDTPKSMDEVIRGLKGFGLEENEEILSFNAGGRTVRLRISNIPTEQEIKALLAAEEFKGYAWVQRIRCEILSRAITWIDGIPIHTLTVEHRMVEDPTCAADKVGVTRADIQVVLRNILLGWGQEVLQTLWKVLMVHCDSIEKRMQQSFPQSALMTEVERRFFEAALKEIRDTSREVIEDTIAKTVEEHLTPEERAELNGTEAKKA